MDDSFGFFRDARRLLKEYGWHEGREFEEWMRRQIRSLSGKADLTFGDLERRVRAGGGKYRLLYMVGTDLTTQDCRYYSHEHTPQTPIWKAVRISMSIPLFFKAVIESGKVLVDGGLTYNYPIDLFDDKKYVPDPKARIAVNYPTRYGPGHVYNKETLGFRVDTKDEIRAEKLHWKLPPAKIKNFGDYARALIGFVSDMANKVHLHTNDWHRTVFIDAKGVGTTDFGLPAAKVRTLLESGREGTRDYFRWFESPAPGEPAPLNRIR
jgi:NTE family protein